MKSLNVNSNITYLIKKGIEWQKTDVNGQINKRFLFLLYPKLAILLCSIFIVMYSLTATGYSNEIVGYILAFYAIFIGMLLSLALTIFDKFQRIEFAPAKYNHDVKIVLLRTKNFIKQFTTLMFYAILIALFNIVLLIFSFFLEFLHANISKSIFIDSWSHLNIETISLFIILTLNIVHRIAICFLLFNFIWVVLYAIAAMFRFIMNDYDRIKITEDK